MTLRALAIIIFLYIPVTLNAQYNRDSVLRYREQYKRDFLTDKNSPLKAEDTSFLRFYKPDAAYCVMASFKPSLNAKPFQIPTHSGKMKNYQEYGVLTFSVKGKKQTLHIYQSLDLIKKDAKYNDYLFIPFNDKTNYVETYAGGRYIDVSKKDIKNNRLVLDFNKCYNPYCAFASGYNCPIPPDENKLTISINAGEKLFGREVKE